MDRELAIARFTALVREKRDGNPWLLKTLRSLVQEGDRDAFQMQCMSVAKSLLDGSMPDGSVQAAVSQLWTEMGG